MQLLSQILIQRVARYSLKFVVFGVIILDLDSSTSIFSQLRKKKAKFIFMLDVKMIKFRYIDLTTEGLCYNVFKSNKFIYMYIYMHIILSYIKRSLSSVLSPHQSCFLKLDFVIALIVSGDRKISINTQYNSYSLNKTQRPLPC